MEIICLLNAFDAIELISRGPESTISAYRLLRFGIVDSSNVIGQSVALARIVVVKRYLKDQ
jgi:hypothetical protein